jgi:hypothetical protein
MTLIMTPIKQAHAKELAKLNFVHRDITYYLSVSEAIIRCNLKTMSNIADAYQRAPVSGCSHKLNDQDIFLAIQAIESGFTFNAADLKCKLFPNVSYTTAKEYLVKAGYHGFIC